MTLPRRDLSRALVITRYHRKLPDVLSVEEAGRLLEAAPGLKPHATQRRLRHRRHRLQIEIPIAVDCAPRVPA